MTCFKIQYIIKLDMQLVVQRTNSVFSFSTKSNHEVSEDELTSASVQAGVVSRVQRVEAEDGLQTLYCSSVVGGWLVWRVQR